MTTKTATSEIERPRKTTTYVAGTHTNRVKAEHEERRTELLARDEILAGEIERRQAEREDIGEALRLMSDPGVSVKNVLPFEAAAE